MILSIKRKFNGLKLALCAAGPLAMLSSCSTGLEKQTASVIQANPSGIHPLRIGIRGSYARSNEISGLTYHSTFQAQTLLYETLVKRDSEGRIAPGLASSWEFADGGRTVIFTIRENARWHDGTPVTADDIRIHLKRWTGLPEFAWIHSSDRIREIVAESPRRLRITMDQPGSLLPDLCAIRPGSIDGPGCRDGQGTWIKPVGSGPFKFVELRENGSVYRLQRFRPQGEPVKTSDFIDLIPFNAEASDEGDPFALFRKGKLDILIDGWKSRIPREQLPWIRQQPDLHVQEAPGSVLHYVSFRLDGPTADRNLRLHIVNTLNRSELIEKVESGYADPTYAWAAPTVKTWPQLRSPAPVAPLPQLTQPLRLLGYQNHFRPREKQWCEALVTQLKRAGIPVECTYLAGDEYKKALAAGEYDLRTEITWGLPYDPDMSLKSRFLPATFNRPSGAGNRYFGVDPRSEQLARKIAGTPDEKDRLPLYEQMQKLLSEEALVVPLFVPRRIAVIRGRDIRLPFDHDVYRDAITALTDQP